MWPVPSRVLQRPPNRRGFTRQPESPNVHIDWRAPVFKNTTKIRREDTQRETKRAKMEEGEGKNKERHFGQSSGGPSKGSCVGRSSGGRGERGRGENLEDQKF